jgi:hypothetical protein
MELDQIPRSGSVFYHQANPDIKVSGSSGVWAAIRATSSVPGANDAARWAAGG